MLSKRLHSADRPSGDDEVHSDENRKGDLEQSPSPSTSNGLYDEVEVDSQFLYGVSRWSLLDDSALARIGDLLCVLEAGYGEFPDGYIRLTDRMGARYEARWHQQDQSTMLELTRRYN